MMIHCKECGNAVSDTAEKCPKCGAIVMTQGAALLFFLAAGFVLYGMYKLYFVINGD